ncbi:hypothetical protein AGMMS50239_06260 [Bacteroidia bacterium]|nr:hypothetical protein AGMMS50239_06260 [Bacteroidia bacterium]
MNLLKCYFVLVLLTVLLWACSPTNETFSPWDAHLSTEQNIAKNAIALENNEDFSFLDKIVNDRSFVILGEEGHFDYSTTEVKIEMIDYLQEKGFHSIAVEGVSFFAAYVFSNPQYAELTKNWNIGPFYFLKENMLRKENIRGGKKHRLFFEKIQNRKIRLWGIDSHGTVFDIDVIKKILDDHYSGDEILSINWDKLKDLYFRKFIHTRISPDYHKLSIDEEYGLMRMIDTISNYTQYLMSSRGADMDLKAIMQWIRNINTSFSNVEYQNIKNESQMALSSRNRDSQMAENIGWIVKNFPEEKFIVLCANFHGAKDISQTRYPTDSLLYFTFQSMGEALHATHGDKMYSLAFTSLWHAEEKENSELEMEIANTTNNVPYAFIDFEPLRFADGYRDKEFESRIIGKKRGKWLYIFDGLYYIRYQEVDHSLSQKYSPFKEKE